MTENTVIEIETPGGASIDHTIRMLVVEARHYTAVTLKTVLNGVTVLMDAQSDPELLIRDWERSMDRGSDKFVVGPRALEVLPLAELALDAHFARKRMAAQQDRWDERNRKEAKRQNTLRHLLEGAPEFAFVSAEAQAKFEAARALNAGDAYSARPFSYALEVGRLVQNDPLGPTVLALKVALKLADDGLSGYLDSVARRLLLDFWAHGHLLVGL